ncbi:FeoA domain, partial [Dysosmobacter welbionis]
RRHFSWISQPMEVRSGSLPAVVSTSTVCCRRAASEPVVSTFHRSRPARPLQACSSSQRMAEKEGPCLLSTS